MYFEGYIGEFDQSKKNTSMYKNIFYVFYVEPKHNV